MLNKIVVFLLFAIVLLKAQEFDSFSIALKGCKAPAFRTQTIDGISINIDSLKGKVVLLNFFATWCPPCREELPEVEKEIINKFDKSNLIVLSIGRCHTAKELLEFKNKTNYKLNFVPDPKTEIYQLYASKYIPRNYVIDQNGIVVYSGVGYEKEEFGQLLDLLSKLLKK